MPKQRPGPVGGKRDENRRKRIDTLVTAARTLFLQRGIAEVTIDEIVQSAGMAKGSFYRYFGDKLDLVRAMFAVTQTALEDAFNACDRQLQKARTPEELFPAYQTLAEALSTLAFETPEIVLLYLQENRAPMVPSRAPVMEISKLVTKASIALTNAAHTHKLLKPVHPQLSALIVVGAVERLLYAVLTGEKLGEPEEIPNALITVILDGIRAS